MVPDVVSAIHKGKYRLEIVFQDGKTGVVDFEKYIKEGGVFAKLRDLNAFLSFFINPELGILAWPGDIDIAPETLYSEATGEPLPQWMHVNLKKSESGIND